MLLAEEWNAARCLGIFFGWPLSITLLSQVNVGELWCRKNFLHVASSDFIMGSWSACASMVLLISYPCKILHHLEIESWLSTWMNKLNDDMAFWIWLGYLLCCAYSLEAIYLGHSKICWWFVTKFCAFLHYSSIVKCCLCSIFL